MSLRHAKISYMFHIVLFNVYHCLFFLSVYTYSFIFNFFILLLVLKIMAEKFKPLNYFMDSWNAFDAVVIIGSFIPGSGSALVLLRLLRLLRILKLAKAFPQLAILVNALIKGTYYIQLTIWLYFYPHLSLFKSLFPSQIQALPLSVMLE